MNKQEYKPSASKLLSAFTAKVDSRWKVASQWLTQKSDAWSRTTKAIILWVGIALASAVLLHVMFTPANLHVLRNILKPSIPEFFLPDTCFERIAPIQHYKSLDSLLNDQYRHFDSLVRHYVPRK
ncbi:hypothetical protein [Pseudochryseolinea flava]|uniref:Uncharacterized protein n=1 Tax=Pseudochryseolinea flava TaxID=2059302 RepID=A0A364XX75_9BACT|nr:hypothetical protein [Pseudochryseolinea flava]RAV98855.1 hypothetical protein DQQ10_21365 [Pseudochryseolinea flava]